MRNEGKKELLHRFVERLSEKQAEAVAAVWGDFLARALTDIAMAGVMDRTGGETLPAEPGRDPGRLGGTLH